MKFIATVRIPVGLFHGIALASLLIASSCKDDEPIDDNSAKVSKQYVAFDLSANYLNDFNTSTQTFDLEDGGLAFISLRKKEAYKLKNGEAANHQSEIDFVYQVSGSGRTGYLSNTGYFKPTENGYKKSPFGPNWTIWNEVSLIGPARTLKTDPVTGASYGLSDELFNAITNTAGLAAINFGDDASVPLDDTYKLVSSVHFDIWEDGKVEDNNYFVFTLGNGDRGVFKVRKDDDATSLSMTVKMAY